LHVIIAPLFLIPGPHPRKNHALRMGFINLHKSQPAKTPEKRASRLSPCFLRGFN